MDLWGGSNSFGICIVQWKDRISIAHTSKKLSQEHCERISKGLKELHKRRTTE
jgi:hypothetical protein